MLNPFWIYLERIVFAFSAFISTILISKFLGAHEFGIYSYVISLLALFQAISSLGYDKLLVKDMMLNPIGAEKIIANAITLRLFSFSIIIFMLFSSFLFFDYEKHVILLSSVLALTYLFKSFDVTRYFFESKLQVKNIVLINVGISFFSLLLVYISVFMNFTTIFFILIILVGSFLTSMVSYIHFRNSGFSIKVKELSFSKITELFNKGLPIAIAGTISVFMTRMDQIMIGNMIGMNEVGIYAIAVRFNEGFMILLSAFAMIVYPLMIKGNEKNEESYMSIIMSLLTISVIASVVIIFTMYFWSEYLVLEFFGQDYRQASSILLIHCLGLLFTSMGIIIFRHLVIKGLQRISLHRAIFGLIINFILNYISIPIYGLIGAAWSTVVSSFLALYLFNFFNYKTRNLFYLQTRSLLFLGIPSLINKLLKIKNAT